MAERSNLEQNLIPKYKFEWENQETRTTDDLPEQTPEVNETLAELGKQDSECEVTLVGYST